MLLPFVLAAILQAAAPVSGAEGADRDPPATAQTPANPAPGAKNRASARASDLVCRTEQVVGTRFPTKICAYKGDFEKRGANDRQVVMERQRMGFNCRTNGLTC